MEVPHDLLAEKAVIGACLINQKARQKAVDLLSPSDFYSPQLSGAFVVIVTQHHAGQAVDSVTVAGAGVPMSVINEAKTEVPVSGNISTYAARIQQLAMLRRTIAWSTDLKQKAFDQDGEAVLEQLSNTPEMAIGYGGSVEPGIEASELRKIDTTQRFIVPNLLTRDDRLIITGPEGFGKSELLAQWAVMTASGIEWFSRAPFDPNLKVLFVDLENSISSIKERFVRLLDAAGSRYPNSLFIKSRPQGLNILNAADERWLDQLFNEHKPDAVFLGPLYKAFSGSERMPTAGEEAAAAAARCFDRLRVKHNCALVIEAHSPHGESGDRAGLRPYGASLWRRWPEFGFGLKPTGTDGATLVAWRGARHRDRVYPETIRKGNVWSWEI